ncbi:MAG: NAD(+)/NADH kinase [Bacillota bacterium]
MKLGILANTTKNNTADFARLLIHDLKKRGHTCIIGDELAASMHEDAGVLPCQVCKQADLILALGGDGTVLRAVSAAAHQEKPVLGINMGRVGFLSEALPGEISEVLDAIDAGALVLDYRTMVQAAIAHKDSREPQFIYSSFNDVSITRHKYTGIVRLDVYIQDEFAGTVTGDGVLVSTPTGSSAYALSCGGPLVHPSLDVLVIAPISGHVRSMRPMVVPGDSIIRIRPHGGHRELDFSVDGKFGACLSDFDEAVIRRAPYQAVLAHIKPYHFYEIVRSKIYGEDISPNG